MVVADETGLLTDTATIGTRQAWERRVREHGYQLRGHRLVRCAKPES